MLKHLSLNTVLSTVTVGTTLLMGAVGEADAALFTGTSSGSWILPEGLFGTELLDVDGGINNRIEWGIPTARSPENNSLQYDGLNFDIDENSSFVIGNLTYFNGEVDGNSNNFDDDFALDVELAFESPVTGTENFNYAFNIFQTDNTGNPDADADTLSFAANGLTTNTFSFDGVDYTLQLLGFSDDGGNTFLNELKLPEITQTNAFLYAQITAAPPEVTVPEPTVLLGLGLLGVYLTTSRRKSR